MFDKAKKAMSCFGLLLGLLPVLALAQSGQIIVLEEIIVTAQKRDQNLQDIGIAVTAFSGNQLRALGISDSVELAQPERPA